MRGRAATAIKTEHVERASTCRETFPPVRNTRDQPISGAPGTSLIARRRTYSGTVTLAQATSSSPAASNGWYVSASSQDHCCANARPGTRRVNIGWECHVGLRTGERERVPACAGHDQRSGVRGYVRNTWNRMRGGGGADIRIGSERAGRCGWRASAKMEECPQISGSHTSGDGAGGSA
jgi:hypothetical protein